MSSLVSITQGITKQAAFADDLAGAGPLELLRSWCDAIVKLGPFLSYHPEPSKSWLIVKQSYLEEANIVFAGSGIKITGEGRKHLGAVVGSQDYKLEFINKQIDWWVRELLILSEIALVEPHAAYSAFTHGYRHKFTYTMRTIDGISQELIRLDEAINKLVQNLFYGHDVSAVDRKIISLPVRMEGLGLIIPSEIADSQYQRSTLITSPLSNVIIEQRDFTVEDNSEIKKKRRK